MKNFFHSGKLLLLVLPLGMMPDALSATNYPSVSSSYTVQQTLKVSGIVTDSEGEPLTGATIRIEGTTTGAMSGIDGEYALNAKEGDMIVVSYIGYKTVKVKVGNTQVLNFTLQPDVVTTEEVVVIGYGSQKKVNLTGAVASINTDVIQSRPQSNVVSALQGLVPGVTIINRPGSTPSVNFRGRGNLGTSEPLYVVDGVIVDAGFFSSIDPNVIENISFLKDAASSSIYGSRAAYGVVLVTTKNGSKGTTQVTYNGMVGAKKFTYTPEYVNSWEYAELFNEAMYNTTPAKGKFQKYTQEQIDLFRDGSQPDLYPNTDWVDLIYDKYAVTTQHSLNLTGGTDKLSFFSGFGI
ncbi:MAG: TonB-dependent receptor plug domain-containing protein, partial [Tannerellaceae bacterium]